jgi:hypothetical protein
LGADSHRHHGTAHRCHAADDFLHACPLRSMVRGSAWN